MKLKHDSLYKPTCYFSNGWKIVKSTFTESYKIFGIIGTRNPASFLDYNSNKQMENLK